MNQRRHGKTVPGPAIVGLPKSEPKTHQAGGMKTFRVTGGNGGGEQVIEAATVDASDGKMTFKDDKGNLVGIISGYGISAVVDTNARPSCGDPCQSVSALKLI